MKDIITNLHLFMAGDGLYRVIDDHLMLLFTLRTQERFPPFDRRRFLYAGHCEAENLIGHVDAKDGETLEDSVRLILRNEATFLLRCANNIVSQ